MTICDYCQNPAELVTGKEIYPHRRDLWSKKIYRCVPCAAYVGCHDGTTHALGRLANAELRAAKMAAHAAFDPKWRNGAMKRKEAYKWLADKLGIERNECHIGMFDVSKCASVVNVCSEG